MAAITHTAAHKYGADGGFSDQGEADIVRELREERIAVYFAHFIQSSTVERRAGQRAEPEKLVQVSGLQQKVLIAQQLIPSIGAELQRSSQRKRLEIEVGCSKGRAAGRRTKHGSARADSSEITCFGLQTGIGAAIDSGVEPLKCRLLNQAAARDDRVV